MYATELKAIKLIEENTSRPLFDINVNNIFFLSASIWERSTSLAELVTPDNAKELPFFKSALIFSVVKLFKFLIKFCIT